MLELVVTPFRSPWLLIGVVLTVCCVGDWIQSWLVDISSNVPSSSLSLLKWLRALLDSTTHGVVALVSWFAISWPGFSWQLSLLSFVAGAAIDLDHVLAAGSFNIDAITHLHHRPPLHATTPWLLLLAPLLAARGSRLRVTSALLLNASLTHHIRDACRRGLWLPPFGSTSPLSVPIYLSLEALVPLSIAALLRARWFDWLTIDGVSSETADVFYV